MPPTPGFDWSSAFFGPLSGPPLGTVLMGDDGTILVTVRRQNWAVAWISGGLVILLAIGLAFLIAHAKFHEPKPIPPAPVANCQPFCSAVP
ncbi:hypothetical protein [Nocardia seriolae]|uniref:Uncharacterized protein n=1 Tax=Nocardia seriolae TaxID=37332 RepID=A0ABC8AZT0_9NOCA|nr:hypothetical protein [Nocardia seriolae]APA99678.1 hypothetical protein NS506_05632 [Nocardia seriolae]MTJ64245.1 hypothetical protein [Nocardia seriolae]MTJ72847.1 hypothetical protein [Nocardia seriolae]MTJ89236.1 hypothetical protein [Nocardia seriolae]MTK33214.1 hypothetical protein [Nocardia seriolae]